MKNKKILFITLTIFMICLSIGTASATDADDAIASVDDEVILEDSGPTTSDSISGGVDVVTENPWTKKGELCYDIPTEAKTIKRADVYIDVYSGSATNSYGANANITFTTDNGETEKSELLWIEDGSTDGTVYTVNDHTTKCYSDYMIHYDITDSLDGLSGTSLKINVETFQMEGKQYDGRIKLIALVLAYDDEDDDVINYWVNDEQLWTQTNASIIFGASSLKYVSEANLTNIGLSSGDADYEFNNISLPDAEHVSGEYYQYNKWDVTEFFTPNKTNEFIAYYAGRGITYPSFRNSLSVLTAKKFDIESTVSLATECLSNGVNIAYPGTYNQIKVTAETNKKDKYTLQLLADGELVNSTEVSLETGSNIVDLIDPTIRAIDESTAYALGAYNNVTYTVRLLLKGQLVNESSLNAAVLYNGYFNKDLSYPSNDFASFLNETINGDIVINVSSHAYAPQTNNRTDTWNVILPDNSSFTKAFIYVPFSNAADDSIDLFSAAFNDAKLSAVFFSRDQANIISAGNFGLIVYDVSSLIQEGENTFVLNKTTSAGAFPSTLIYLYNTTNSEEIKNVYISNGADLIGTYGNAAERQISLDSLLNVDSSIADSAIAYIFGAGSKTGSAAIIINGEEETAAWDTDLDNQINIYSKDISKTVKDSNEVSIVLKKDMFLALQQIIVATKYKTVPTTITAPDITLFYKSNGNLIVTLKDIDGNSVSNATVKVVLNGAEKVLTTDAQGKATLAIPKDLVPNTYTATISFAGNGRYDQSSNTAKVIIKKINTKLNASKVTATYNVNKYLLITLKDSNGNILANKKLAVKVGSISKTLTTNAKGQVSILVSKLVPKTYTATFSFAGDSIYSKSSSSISVAIKKATPKMTAKAKTFKVKVKTKKYAITLKNNIGKVMKSTKVTLKVNKKTFSAKTNYKGVATFKITNLKKKGKFTAVVKYAGSKYYNKVTKKPIITVKA